MNTKLSIVVITMNRATQLIEALESCLRCKLPSVQFVIVDNASTDDTDKRVHSFFEDKDVDYFYEKVPVNLGVGKGRNYAYSHVKGEYAYFLDDDAVIDTERNNLFFEIAINRLDSNPDIMSLSTQIYDNAWEANRKECSSVKIADNIYKYYMLCGGSHFLRTSFFKADPYYSNKYAYEELLPSIRVADANKLNVFCPDIKIIHNPKVNKWNKDLANLAIRINEFACQRRIKSMLYPRIFAPVLYVAYCMRYFKYLRGTNMWATGNEIMDGLEKNHKINKRVKVSTVITLYKDFGLEIF